MRQIFLDTETTGLSVREGHRLVEIACLEMSSRRLTDRHFHRYLNPERESDPGALAVHGLSSDFLADKPRFAEIAAEFLDFVRDAELIIHNAQFDVGFIDSELAAIDLPPLGEVVANIVDTIQIARELNPGKKANLDALCERYGIDNSHRTLHGALLDAQILAQVYLAMTRGQETLAMDLDASPAGIAGEARALNASRGSLRVLRASEEELAEHERMLSSIDDETKGKCLWRNMDAS